MTTQLRSITFATSVLLGVAFVSPVEAQTDACKGYRLVDIGEHTKWSLAFAISNDGRATGTAAGDAAPDLEHAFRTLPSGLIDAASILPTDTDGARTFGFAISSTGAVAGASSQLGMPYWHLGSPGSLFYDRQSLPGTSQGFVRGMDDGGWSVGEWIGLGGREAVLWYDPFTRDRLAPWLGNPLQSVAYDINNRAEIVGWKDDGGFLFDMRSWRLVALGGFVPAAISDTGRVAGYIWDQSGKTWSRRAAVYADLNGNGVAESYEFTTFGTPIGARDSRATAINAAGVAVGYNADIRPRIEEDYLGLEWSIGRGAMLFTKGTATELSTLVVGGVGNWVLTKAWGINDWGQIVGEMRSTILSPTNFPQTHAFRLDPVCGWDDRWQDVLGKAGVRPRE